MVNKRRGDETVKKALVLGASGGMGYTFLLDQYETPIIEIAVCPLSVYDQIPQEGER